MEDLMNKRMLKLAQDAKNKELKEDLMLKQATEAPEAANSIAVDLLKTKDGKYKRVYIAYNLDTGYATVLAIKDGGDSFPLELQKASKFLVDKLLLDKKDLV